MAAQRLVLDFGLAVRQLREGHGWSQEQLAAQSDLNRSYVGEIERGQVAPSLVTLHKLAQALQLAPMDLLAHADRIRLQRDAQRQQLQACVPTPQPTALHAPRVPFAPCVPPAPPPSPPQGANLVAIAG